PWKWFTRQMRVAHWKERDSMFSSVTLKPWKSGLYSSSGMHGSPTPPLWHPIGRIPMVTTLSRPNRPQRMERVIRTCSFGGTREGTRAEILRRYVSEVTLIDRVDERQLGKRGDPRFRFGLGPGPGPGRPGRPNLGRRPRRGRQSERSAQGDALLRVRAAWRPP